MADELAQLTQVQIEGYKFVFQGSAEIVQFMARALKALIEFNKENSEKMSKELLRKPGEKSCFDDLMQLSEGGIPQGLDIRSVDLDEVLRLGTEKGLHFWKAIDFDPNDGMTPIMFPYQEAAVWGQIYKSVADKRLSVDKNAVDTYSDSIAELREKLNNSSSEEKNDLQLQLDSVIQAKDEADKWVEYGENLHNTPDSNICYDFNSYLAKSKGTDFEQSPEIAMAEYAEGVEIGPKFSCKDCMQPIRDKSLMPESAVRFLVPDSGVIITRSYNSDEKTGLVYSDYSFKAPNGEMFDFTDRNVTKEGWNREVLPKLLTSAGIFEGTMCRVFDDRDKRDKYVKLHNTIENPAKKRIEEKIAKGESVFSSAEAKREILNAVSDHEKGIASAPITNQPIVVRCPANAFRNVGGKLDLELSETEHLQFSSVASAVADVDTPGMFRLTFTEACNPTLIETRGDKSIRFPMSLTEAQAKMDEVFKLGGKAASEVASVMRNKGR